MVKRNFLFLPVAGFTLLISSLAQAQLPVVSGEQVKAWLDEKRKFVLIDARPGEEYVQGHIPGAVNIPAERMKAERAKLPKDTSALLVFYCRGTG